MNTPSYYGQLTMLPMDLFERFFDIFRDLIQSTTFFRKFLRDTMLDLESNNTVVVDRSSRRIRRYMPDRSSRSYRYHGNALHKAGA